jgi:hypothetical protein
LAPYPTEIIYDWRPMTVQFWAEDKFLHDMSFFLVIHCSVDERAYPNEANNFFTVTMYDECF